MADPGVVRLVVLNFNGGDEVVRCVEHLTRLDWPADQLDVVLVDNASTDGSAQRVVAGFPQVRVVPRSRNDGFPANNDALRDLDGVRYVGLVNNDAFVEPAALGALVAALDDDGELGAACPLMVFEHRFVDMRIVTTAEPAGRGDPRALGLKLAGLRVDGVDLWSRTRLSEGGHGREFARSGAYEWTGDAAVLAVPVPRSNSSSGTVELLVSALSSRSATFTSGSRVTEAVVGRQPAWVRVAIEAEPVELVNNAGSIVFDDGYGADRGFGEPAPGDYTEGADVFAWCGGAVLLRPDYLRDVGLFDERFFLYYEDTDLSWRGQARGWRYRYVPEARVRHLHAATTGEGSVRFAYFTERNRLVMVLKNGSPQLVRRAIGGYLGQTYDAARRDIVGALLRRRRPNATVVSRRLRALIGVLRLAPGALVARRRLRARQTEPDGELETRMVTR